MGSFCTAVNCMDGRVQLPVMNYMVASFGTGYVDSVTESGPVRYLAECQDSQQAKSILERVDLSVDVHGSRTV
ncbi:MAG: hypothetical protein H8D47_04110, partial [Planctomycetes bacterium]|nr:hypothetical protein [Planctomycetota bacterium]